MKQAWKITNIGLRLPVRILCFPFVLITLFLIKIIWINKTK